MSLLPVPRTSDLHEVSLVLSASPCIALHRPASFSARFTSPLAHDTELGELDWHTLAAEEVVQRLSSSPSVGLDDAQVQRKLKEHGLNQISPPPKNLFKKIVKYVLGGFGPILLVASIICFIAWCALTVLSLRIVCERHISDHQLSSCSHRKPLGKPAAPSNLALAVVLLIVLVLNAVFNFWQDFSTSKILDSITGMLPSDVTVIRNGSVSRIAASQIVPGDIVELSLGQKVPADTRLLSVASDLKFDRSILTGESDAIDGKVDQTSENFLESEQCSEPARTLSAPADARLFPSSSQEHRHARHDGAFRIRYRHHRTDGRQHSLWPDSQEGRPEQVRDDNARARDLPLCPRHRISGLRLRHAHRHPLGSLDPERSSRVHYCAAAIGACRGAP